MAAVGFSLESINNNKHVVYVVNKEDTINYLEYNMLSNNHIKGLLNIIYGGIDDEFYYKYDIASNTALIDILETDISMDEFRSILTSIYDLFIELDDYLINREHLVTDENYVYIDATVYSLRFICLPIEKTDSSFDMKGLLLRIIENVRPIAVEDKSYIGLISDVLETNESIELNQLLDLIKEITAKRTIKINSSIVSKQSSLPSFTVREEKNQSINLPVDFKIPVVNKVKKASECKELVSKAKSKKKKENKFMAIIKSAVENKTPPSVIVQENVEEISDTAKCDHTVIINDSKIKEETSFLYALNSGFQPIQPYLIRSINDEKIYLNHDLFRLGKNSDLVDYAIEDNVTISRIHAEIIRINSEYFIRDNNSKNHTYVNGVPIKDTETIKLEHNSKIVLSDECFIFKMY